MSALGGVVVEGRYEDHHLAVRFDKSSQSITFKIIPSLGMVAFRGTSLIVLEGLGVAYIASRLVGCRGRSEESLSLEKPSL
jgi:hypothetical protein